MTHQIVVPLDMSAESESALPLARSLARQFSAQVVLISVIEVTPDLDDFVSTREFKEGVVRLEREMSEYLGTVAMSFPDTAVETVIRMGSPHNEIVWLVENLDRPLVVMASRGRSGIPRQVIGSVTMRIIHSVDCPVFVVKSTSVETGPIQRVLVPLDGSGFAESALDVVLSLFPPDVLDLSLIRVLDFSSWRRLPFVRADYQQDARRSADEYLERVVSDLEKRGIAVTAEVREGPAAEQIRRLAAERNVDLVAMATHGRTGLKRVLMGSAAESVLREIPLPLLLVPPRVREG